jgi:hypothetical protein
MASSLVLLSRASRRGQPVVSTVVGENIGHTWRSRKWPQHSQPTLMELGLVADMEVGDVVISGVKGIIHSPVQVHL